MIASKKQNFAAWQPLSFYFYLPQDLLLHPRSWLVSCNHEPRTSMQSVSLSSNVHGKQTWNYKIVDWPSLFVALPSLFLHFVKWAHLCQNQETPQNFQTTVDLQKCFLVVYQGLTQQASQKIAQLTMIISSLSLVRSQELHMWFHIHNTSHCLHIKNKK